MDAFNSFSIQIVVESFCDVSLKYKNEMLHQPIE